MKHNDLAKTFWDNHKAIKRKTTNDGEITAPKEQLFFVSKYIAMQKKYDLWIATSGQPS